MGAKRTKAGAPSFLASGDTTSQGSAVRRGTTQALRVLNYLRVSIGLAPYRPDELSVARAASELARTGLPTKGRK
jgi:hypothetical protein